MMNRLLSAAALIALPSLVSAATIDVSFQGSVVMAGLGAPPSMSDSFELSAVGAEGLASSDSGSAAASGYFGSGTASAQYSVDATTGQLRFGLTGAVTAVPEGRGAVGVFGTMSLTEAFHIVGSGIVTIGMAVSAAWSVDGSFGLDASVTYDSLGLGGSSFGTNTFSPDPTGTTLLTGSLSGHIIDVSFVVPEGTDGLVDFTWFLQGGIEIDGGAFLPSTTSFLDAMNTANIFVTTSGDVTATPVTAQFLSNPAHGPSPVPLPASGVMLVAALAAFGAMRRVRAVR